MDRDPAQLARRRILDAIDLFERRQCFVTTLQVAASSAEALGPETAELVEALLEELDLVYLRFEDEERQHVAACDVPRRMRKAVIAAE